MGSMTDTTAPALDGLDWAELEERLDADGVAGTPPLLSAEQCAGVIAMFDEDERFRGTVVMALHAFGRAATGTSATRSRHWSSCCASGSTRRSRPSRTGGPGAWASAASPPTSTA